MNRTDRLLAIVLELQSKKWVRAEDMAATFEVSVRTIYRDMMALSETGVPIVSVTGQGYTLVEGYFLPPLRFNTAEAIMLLLGTESVAQNFDTQYHDAALSANQKIVAVLSDGLRREVEYLKSSFQFVVFNEPDAPETLQTLRSAIIQHKTVCFSYHSRYRDDQPNTQRETDPYALIHIDRTWTLIAYCHLRKDIRHFRLDRMEDVVILDRSFTRPKDFKIQLGSEDDRTVVVRVLFDHHVVSMVREAPSGFQVNQEAHPDGLLITFAVRKPQDLLSWLLGWGSHIRVLEPESLRKMLVHEAESMLKNHQMH
jgi:predicted DNA-binding transcriptional regulator YafY